MNIVARSVELEAGDQVLLTDHEYGAVRRLWQKTCQAAGAELVVRPLPWPLLERGLGRAVGRAPGSLDHRSHSTAGRQPVTSATATTLPIE
ncbi:MAG: hypothetical protein Ct9H300mP1_20700 [Planctomycetaceae bacterium]|nr:MAG: hypothetical protein Ct9H300mP1_20700 [Planctomycetaceae bacterium]